MIIILFYYITVANYLRSVISLDVPERCRKAPPPNQCRMMTKAYYFDDEEGRCKEFTNCGTFTNENRFSTKEECFLHCLSPTLVSSQDCLVDWKAPDEEPNPVKGTLYAFNPRKARCVGFKDMTFDIRPMIFERFDLCLENCYE
ncbi:Kunitz-type serine protease inhibitor vestiginin-3 [Thelohanellus kitauei]|uniref:Kunitz-type serine protease inhibitor vestiginin-3 n=1 Tax=Thelohanellus kitauei TaxID=669202 RepID=A0A0C2J4W2_THEKT|nr:Kunitz-type serine protease inhibitor vestiginin-3 [Thelohanellus kitauei]